MTLQRARFRDEEEACVVRPAEATTETREGQREESVYRTTW